MKRKAVFIVCALLICLPFASESKQTSSGKGSAISPFLTRAREKGVISQAQLESLLELAEEEDDVLFVDVVDSSSNKTSNQGVFMRMYNHLTLLNVLYFSGSLLIIGAYTLLMTLAFEHFTGMGLGNMMTAQATAFGIIGIYLWGTDYQFLGGLLVSISTSLVPYTVYCYERAFNLWPGEDPGTFMDFRLWVRSGWVAMEVATVVIGFLYLCVVPFPFLLAPVSFALWFLSMDIAPMFPDFSVGNAYEVRRKISLVFGIGLLLLGLVMEWLLGSDPDFGFWLYLFGLIAFWFALVFHPDTDDPLALSVFLLINICLVLIGSHLDRVTFHLFGTVGVALMVHSLYFRRTRFESNFLLWMLKALATVSLLSNAIKTGGSIEILNAAVCFVAFNLEGFVYITRGEAFSCLLLLTNLGFISVLPSFNRPLNLWFFELPSAQLLMSLCSLSVCLFHITVLRYYSNRFELNTKDVRFLTYRVFASVLITVVLLFLDQYWWAWVGAVGIPLIAMLTQPNRSTDPASLVTTLSQYSLLLLAISIAVFIDSNLFYLVSCLCMGVTILFSLNRQFDDKVLACALSVGLIVLAIPLQSKFMIAIGGIYIFGYLSHLAYNVFKNSLMFPLALIGLGLGLIYVGVMYQMYQETLYVFSAGIVPINTIGAIQEYIQNIDWYSSVRNATFSNVLQNPFIWLMWPGPMVHALSKEAVPYAGYGCGLGIVMMLLGMVYLNTVNSQCPDLTEQVKVSSFTMSLARNIGSGIIVKIRGTKPAYLEQPQYISMNIYGERFWKAMGQQFGSIPVKLIRSAFLPYQLTPSLITLDGFKSGSTTFSAVIELGTGKQGKPSISHESVINNCQKVQRNHSPMHCVLMYSNALYLPYASLCDYDTSMDKVCEMLERQDTK